MTKIYIDAGHGGQDSGAVGNGLREKDIALSIANEMSRILLNEYVGVQTKLTRTTDVFLGLGQRANNANVWGADAFVSIHCNSGGGWGFETFRMQGINDPKLVGFQNAVHNRLLGFYKNHGTRDRGKKTANFAVLRQSNMIAVLTENLFMDNVEITKFNDRGFLNSVARAHVEGVASYFGLKRKGGGNDGTTIAPSGGAGKDAGTQGLGIAYIEGSNINLRNAPSISGAVIRKLNNGESYVVWVKKDGWLNLGGDQWVKYDSSYITFARRQSSNVGKLVVSKVDGLWVYSKPDWNAKEKTVKKGDAFRIVDELTVSGSKMYKCAWFYITANPEFVEVK